MLIPMAAAATTARATDIACPVAYGSGVDPVGIEGAHSVREARCDHPARLRLPTGPLCGGV